MHCNIFKASSSDAVLLLECQVLRDKSVHLRIGQIVLIFILKNCLLWDQTGLTRLLVPTHPIDHALDQLNLTVAKPVLVGNVVGDS